MEHQIMFQKLLTKPPHQSGEKSMENNTFDNKIKETIHHVIDVFPASIEIDIQ